MQAQAPRYNGHQSSPRSSHKPPSQHPDPADSDDGQNSADDVDNDDDQDQHEVTRLGKRKRPISVS